MLLALTACGSSSSGPTDLANFTGAEWTGALSLTANCAGTADTVSDPFMGMFTAQGASGFTATSFNGGCVFDFNVSGNTATLSNGPVSCGTTTTAGAAVLFSFTSYTLTTSDGAHLTGTVAGSATEGGLNCSLTGTVVATR